MELLAAVLPGSSAAVEEMRAWPRCLDRYEGVYEQDRLRWLASYVDALAHHVGKTLVPGATGYLPELFAAIELVLAEGDEAAQHLVRIGMLHWLHTVSWPHRSPRHELTVRLHESMAEWLGPVSQEWWDRFTEDKHKIGEFMRRNLVITEDGRYVIRSPGEQKDA